MPKLSIHICNLIFMIIFKMLINKFQRTHKQCNKQFRDSFISINNNNLKVYIYSNINTIKNKK